MLIHLLFACTQDHYLTHPVNVTRTEAEDTAAETPPLPPEPVCDGPLLSVAPRTVEFTAMVTPFPEDIELRTAVADVTIKNVCDVAHEVYVITTGGELGRFHFLPENGDESGAGSGEYVITVPPYTSEVRSISYTADDNGVGVAYDRGEFVAYVIEDKTLGYMAEAKLKATVINVDF